MLWTTSAAAPAAPPDLAWVGDSPMFPTRTLYQNLVGSMMHTRLVDAIDNSGLAETLDGTRNYTVFAPTDAAFRALADVDDAPRMRGEVAIRAVVGHHVIPGRLSVARLLEEIGDAGVVRYATLSRSVLTFRATDDGLLVTDAGGHTAQIIVADIRQTNGIIHVIDTVMRPD